LFDEPTNAADMEMIDSMADAIKSFNGGVMVISHDFRLLQQIAEEIWVIDHGLTVFDGSIRDYKKSLKSKFGYKKEAATATATAKAATATATAKAATAKAAPAKAAPAKAGGGK
jgi:ATP-binding cassette subfamily F protein 2